MFICIFDCAVVTSTEELVDRVPLEMEETLKTNVDSKDDVLKITEKTSSPIARVSKVKIPCIKKIKNDQFSHTKTINCQRNKS